MNPIFLKQFKSPLAHLAAFLVVIFFSMLVAGYSYVQAKQIKIEADLLIAGEVRTNNLCIGGVCKGAWPAELVPGDYAALGQQGCAAVYTYCCGDAQAFADWSCPGITEWDPRNIMSPRGTVTQSCNCPAGPWAGQSYQVLADPPACSGGFNTITKTSPAGFTGDFVVDALLYIPPFGSGAAYSSQACKQP